MLGVLCGVIAGGTCGSSRRATNANTMGPQRSRERFHTAQPSCGQRTTEELRRPSEERELPTSDNGPPRLLALPPVRTQDCSQCDLPSDVPTSTWTTYEMVGTCGRSLSQGLPNRLRHQLSGRPKQWRGSHRTNHRAGSAPALYMQMWIPCREMSVLQPTQVSTTGTGEMASPTITTTQGHG